MMIIMMVFVCVLWWVFNIVHISIFISLSEEISKYAVHIVCKTKTHHIWIKIRHICSRTDKYIYKESSYSYSSFQHFYTFLSLFSHVHHKITLNITLSSCLLYTSCEISSNSRWHQYSHQIINCNSLLYFTHQHTTGNCRISLANITEKEALSIVTIRGALWTLTYPSKSLAINFDTTTPIRMIGFMKMSENDNIEDILQNKSDRDWQHSVHSVHLHLHFAITSLPPPPSSKSVLMWIRLSFTK